MTTRPTIESAGSARRQAAEGSVVVSTRQQRVWLLEQLQPGTPVHNVPLGIRATGELDADALRHALDALVARHASLRLSFSTVDDSPAAHFLAPFPLELVEIDVGEESSPSTAARVAVELEARRGFDLAGPLVRAALVRLGPDEHHLLLTTHRIACDESSLETLFEELAELYSEARLRGAQPAVDPVPAPIDGSDEPAEDDLAYWRGELGGAPALLDLPADRARPAVQSLRAGRATTVVPPELVAETSRFALEYGASAEAAFLAAFAVVLFRYSGQSDLVVGLPARRDPEVAGRVGPFGNTLAIRIRLDGEAGLAELVDQVEATLRRAVAHRSVSFERLVDELDPERDLSRSPLFQVGFELVDEIDAERESAGLIFQRVDVDRGATGLDLTLRLETQRSNLVAVVDYASDLFERASMTRLLGHVLMLLKAGIAAPDRPVGLLPLLTTSERERLLSGLNSTEAPYPRDRTVTDLFSDQVAKRPDAVAVAGPDGKLTYRELERRSDQLARHLSALGVGSETVVGIVLDRTPDLLVAFLGVLKAGGAYVPVDPTYPQARQAFMLEDAKVVISETAIAEELPPAEIPRVLIDAQWDEISSAAAQLPRVDHAAERLAYVMYTSGSTGEPKGVEITHGSLLNLLIHMSREPGLGADDVLVNLTTDAFDLSVPDFYLPLICGAQLVILPRELTLDGRQLADELARYEATFVQATPTTWSILVDSGWSGSDRLKIVCGGDALPRPLANALLERGSSLWHMYGPTETTVWSSIRRLEHCAGPPPIGGPISNTRFYVLDERLQPVPFGIPGQLFIGGDGVARGYRNRPSLTDEKFLRDPFVADAAARMYATGDLVRLHADETIEFLGRIDQQIKLRGFRIELGEVESVLVDDATVREAAVVAHGTNARDRRLVAYVVPTEDGGVDVNKLRARLSSRLPGYMLPTSFVILDALPKTANRKVDRAALPEPDATRPRLDQRYQEPRTPIEKLIAGVWRDVLGLDRLGVDDNFFELGGNSLLATQVVGRLERLLNVQVPLRSIFEFPTVALLASEVVGVLAEAAIADAEVASLLELEHVTGGLREASL